MEKKAKELLCEAQHSSCLWGGRTRVGGEQQSGGFHSPSHVLLLKLTDRFVLLLFFMFYLHANVFFFF